MSEELKRIYILKEKSIISDEVYLERKKFVLSKEWFSRIGFIDYLKILIRDYFEKRKLDKIVIAEVRAKAEKEELERQESILSGVFSPISVDLNLLKGEEAYYKVSAKKYAEIESYKEVTRTRSKKKGVIGRAVVGGVLLGPLGALGGAVTSGSKGTSETIRQNTSSVGVVDTGNLILTNKRFLFVGDNILSLGYSEVPSVEFRINDKVVLKYSGMAKDEYYQLTGSNSSDCELYYKGIMKKLFK